jgi:hypothetical protein
MRKDQRPKQRANERMHGTPFLREKGVSISAELIIAQFFRLTVEKTRNPAVSYPNHGRANNTCKIRTVLNAFVKGKFVQQNASNDLGRIPQVGEMIRRHNDAHGSCQKIQP